VIAHWHTTGDVHESSSPAPSQNPRCFEYGGDSRAALYKKAARYPGLFVKDGRGVFVDLDVYDKILDSRPAAVIKAAKAEGRAA